MELSIKVILKVDINKGMAPIHGQTNPNIKGNGTIMNLMDMENTSGVMVVCTMVCGKMI